jgi:hypothetical protein
MMGTRKANGGPITAKVRKAIRESELSPYMLGKLSGVAYPIINRFLAGERDIRLGTLDKLAPHLRLDIVQRLTK